MKIDIHFRFVFVLFGIILSGIFTEKALGQQTGEVKDQEFVIRKDRVLTLPTQPRKFERVPALPTPKSTTNFDYTVRPFFLSLPPLDLKTEVAQKNFPKKNEELFPGFVRVGLGNYSSPLLEARYTSWEDGDYDFSAKVRHQGFYTGPVDGRNSAETFTNVAADGTIFKDVFQLYGGLKYDRHKFNFYGYDPMNPVFEDFVPSQNILNTFKLTAGIQNIEKMDGINYNGRLSIRGFGDNYTASENEIAFIGNTDFWFEDYLKTAINIELSLTSPRDELYSDIKRNYFKINPYVRYQKENLLVKAGVNLVFENDITLNKNSDFHVFPVLNGQYMIQDEFGIYADFEGDVIRNTYYDFVMENPFLGPSDQLLNTIQNFKTGAGVRGKLLDEFTYEAGFNVGRYRN
uniref:TonB-dependent receptor n=1 Tax=Aquiflexum sp. TaxID=1872584 RepID=UPI0035931CB7